MEVILLQDVDNLGYKDDLLNVKAGYGRNYLIPKGYAVLATESKRKAWEEINKQRKHKEEKLLRESESIREEMKKLSLQVEAKVSESGKIFGSITTLQISDALAAKGFNISRKAITLKEESIKQTGKYHVDIKLHKEISVSLEFDVVGV